MAPSSLLHVQTSAYHALALALAPPCQISGISPKVLHHRWDPHSPDSGMATGMATGMAMHWAMHGQRHVPCHGFN